jgi:ABC-type arginine transport system permease subunit
MESINYYIAIALLSLAVGVALGLLYNVKAMEQEIKLRKQYEEIVTQLLRVSREQQEVPQKVIDSINEYFWKLI